MALLEVWKTFEEQHGTVDDVTKVEAMKPIISKRRRVDQENGQMVEGRFFQKRFPVLLGAHSPFFFSEHVFVFPDDEKESNPTSFKFLQIAHAWKEAQRKKEAETLAPKPSVPRAPEDVDMDENGKPDAGSKADEDQSSGDES